jgi:hypothetical protein
VAGVGFLRVVVRHGLTRPRPFHTCLFNSGSGPLRFSHAQAAHRHTRQEAASAIVRVRIGRSLDKVRGRSNLIQGPPSSLISV